jgi:hypothetical protein
MIEDLYAIKFIYTFIILIKSSKINVIIIFQFIIFNELGLDF